jgi:anthranilate phosphoribosyltransferase
VLGESPPRADRAGGRQRGKAKGSGGSRQPRLSAESSPENRVKALTANAVVAVVQSFPKTTAGQSRGPQSELMGSKNLERQKLSGPPKACPAPQKLSSIISRHAPTPPLLSPLPNAAAEAPGAPGPGLDDGCLVERRRQRLLALGPDRARFRELIGQVGSGEHTSTGLSREEAREAIELMLEGRVDGAQMAAFLIAHRIRRPAPQELTGMLEGYRALGPCLRTPGQRALCFNVPYDGRNRTAPLLPLVALVLAAEGLPVVLHGGEPMPVKYGITLAELFAALGIEWRGLPLSALKERLDRHRLALSHQPDHFAAAERLVPVRDAIGKRPPVASLELLWTPHQGERLLVSGFVHPPTESRAWEALKAAGEDDVLTVKGLEGSTDLPTSRAGITGRMRAGQIERILVHPRDHGISGVEQGWSSLEQWRVEALAALRGEGALAEALIWNLGVYLWQADRLACLPTALDRARALLLARSGERLRQELAA